MYQKKFVVIYIFCTLLLQPCANVNYCSKTCDNNQLHTVCKRGGCSPTRNCNEYKKDQHFFRRVILDAHNEVRSKVATGKETQGGLTSSAANMKALSWDYDLEYVIQCHLNDCIFEHDKCKWTEKYFKVGQNLYMASFTISSRDAIRDVVVQNWYGAELQYMKANIIPQFEFVAEAGHLTQAIWAKTEAIGCARATDGKNFYVGCNYGPTGNMKGASIYREGAGCSQCGGLECNKKWPGLCGEDRLPDPDGSAALFTTKHFATIMTLLIFIAIF